MKKIPTIFERDWEGDKSRVTRQINPECQWVFDGEDYATRKIDGTSVLFKGNKMFRRRELKPGQSAPPDFVSEGVDPQTGKEVGWVPVGDGPDDKWHQAARRPGPWPDGTYELVGPHIQGNPEILPADILVKHGEGLAGPVPDVPRDFDGLCEWLKGHDVEGIVFHHSDGRMAKIKGRDFGIARRK